MKKMHDLGHEITPGPPTSVESEQRRYYPSVRLPEKALGNSPTDGEEFTMLVKCRVRALDNRDKACDVELLAACPSDDYKAPSAPRHSLKESVRNYAEGEED